jgi:putative ABC transport system substrate-binding protein
MTGKRFSLLQEIVPGLSRVACVNDLSVPSGQAALEDLQTAALQLGLQLLSMDVRIEADLEPAFAMARASGAQALYLGTGGAKYVIALLGQRIVELAARERLPAVYNLPQFPENGGLMSYGPLSEAIYRRSAYYVDRILRGANPADLPVEQPNSFEFVVNMTTAQQLGLTFPPNVAAQVTRWIE